MEAKSKQYQLKDKKFYFRNSARAFIEFEAETGKSISEMEETMVDSMHFVYACTKAGMRYEKQPFEMSFDEYIDFVDEQLEVILDLVEGDLKKKLKIP